MDFRFSRPWVFAVGASSIAVVAVAACVGDAPAGSSSGDDGSVNDVANGSDGSAGDSSAQDSGPTGPCNLAADFTTPVAVPGLDALGSVARFSEDELTAYFAINTTDGGPQFLGRARRATLSDTFGPQTMLPTVGAPLVGFHPSLTIDGTTLYFASGAADGGPNQDIYAAVRNDADASFSMASLVPGIDTGSRDEEPFISASGDLWFASDRTTSKLHIWRAAYSTGFGPPAEPNNVNVNDPQQDEYPVLSHDGLTLYFSRSPSGEDRDIFWTHRPDTFSDFAAPELLASVSSADSDRASWLSPDGCRLYIARGATGDPLSMFVASKPAN